MATTTNETDTNKRLRAVIERVTGPYLDRGEWEAIDAVLVETEREVEALRAVKAADVGAVLDRFAAAVGVVGPMPVVEFEPAPPDPRVAALQRCAEWFAENAEQECYGFGAVENPHDFAPDEGESTPEELAAHRQACEAWDRGERDFERPGCLPNEEPWGTGTYVVRSPEMLELRDLCVAAIGEQPATDAEGDPDAADDGETIEDLGYTLADTSPEYRAFLDGIQDPSNRKRWAAFRVFMKHAGEQREGRKP